jgi:hypothetical protein
MSYLESFFTKYSLYILPSFIKDFESAIYFIGKALKIKKDKKLNELLTDIKLI